MADSKANVGEPNEAPALKGRQDREDPCGSR